MTPFCNLLMPRPRIKKLNSSFCHVQCIKNSRRVKQALNCIPGKKDAEVDRALPGKTVKDTFWRDWIDGYSMG